MSNVPKITEFQVKKLHGRMNVSVPIRDNRIIIVGVNGIGKTTILNMLYFTLSCQWTRLLDFNFEQLSIKIKNRRFTVTKEQIEEALAERNLSRAHRYLPASVYKRLISFKGTAEFSDFMNTTRLSEKQINYYSRLFGVPRSMIHSIRDYFRNQYMHKSDEEESLVRSVERFFESELDATILYLPTYRRIEKELGTIFPGIEDQIRNYVENRPRRKLGHGESHIELVEFGMEDVRSKIQDTLSNLNVSSRASLNNLASSYLQDVIRGRGDTYDPKIIGRLDDATFKQILDKVEEQTLNEQDKKHLLDVIRRIKENKNVQTRDGYIAHYFSKLMEIIKSIAEKERPIVSFTEACNNYLYNKKIIYDENKYELRIIEDDEYNIELQMLSSGEKQIISLLSHLYLSPERSFFVIIDEPELSLSVEWQMEFLPDVLKSGNCGFLAAVTHSPFIFDNELDQYAVDLRKCISG